MHNRRRRSKVGGVADERKRGGRDEGTGEGPELLEERGQAVCAASRVDGGACEGLAQRRCASSELASHRQGLVDGLGSSSSSSSTVSMYTQTQYIDYCRAYCEAVLIGNPARAEEANADDSHLERATQHCPFMPRFGLVATGAYASEPDCAV